MSEPDGQLTLGDASTWPPLENGARVEITNDGTRIFDADGRKVYDERNPDRAHARRSDPDTSHAAAASISQRQISLAQRDVLRCVEALGGRASDSQIAIRYDGPRQSPSGLRTRRRELVDLGYLRDSGDRVTLPSGRRSIVWERTSKPGDDR